MKKRTYLLLLLLICAGLSGCQGTKEAPTFAYEQLQDAEIQTQTEETFLYVYVCGAVEAPGVVKLAGGSRAVDALQAAGGFKEDADAEYVNLASIVEDGEKLYFPSKEEAEQFKLEEAANLNGLVDINTADEALLSTLPGIGPSRACDIITYREKNGGFGAAEDIMKVSGIKESVYEKIKDQIVVR